jgi:hypothetical protein
MTHLVISIVTAVLTTDCSDDFPYQHIENNKKIYLGFSTDVGSNIICEKTYIE